jgi:hypothetical protein
MDWHVISSSWGSRIVVPTHFVGLAV